MEKMYTEIRNTYVMPDPGDLSALNLNSCLVARDGKHLYVHPIAKLVGGRAENPSYDHIFGLSDEVKERFMIVNGERKEAKFCTFCKDRLNGITGNCFDSAAKSGGCSFDPSVPVDNFRMDVAGWRKLKPSDVSKDSPFQVPYHPAGAQFDEETIRRNSKMRIVRRHLWDYQKRKEEKYCSRCIYKGLCTFTTRKVIDHCMVTDKVTSKKCIGKINRHFRNVDEFLSFFHYSGKVICHKPKGDKRKTKWVISRPIAKKRFQLLKRSRPFRSCEVTRAKVERVFGKAPLVQIKDKEKTAALLMFFMDQCFNNWGVIYLYRGQTLRPLWILPKDDGIEVAHYPSGYRLRLNFVTLESFNEILRFKR